MVIVTDSELTRQYRILKQMLTAHAILRDRYLRRSVGLDVVMLVCSAIFCATAFASDDIFNWLGFSPIGARNTLRITSIAAFITAVVSLRVDWRGKAVRHSDAHRKLSTVLSYFRESCIGDNSWDENNKASLNSSYWNTMDDIVQIPEKQFVKLKAKHLRKMEISRMLDKHPNCPVSIISLSISVQALIRYLRSRDTQI